MHNEQNLHLYSPALKIAHEIMDDLGMNAEMEGTVIRWMWYAQCEMKVPVQYVPKAAEIPVEDCEAKKPCDYIKTAQLALRHPNNDCLFIPYYAPLAYDLVLNGCKNRDRNYCNNEYTIVEDAFFWKLSSNANGTTLVVQYQAYNFDELGYPIIDRTYQSALTAYVRWKNAVRQNSMNGLRGGNMSAEQIAKKDWLIAAQYTRGEKAMQMITTTEMQQIAARWNDPYYKSLNRYSRVLNNYNFRGTYNGTEGAIEATYGY